MQIGTTVSMADGLGTLSILTNLKLGLSPMLLMAARPTMHECTLLIS